MEQAKFKFDVFLSHNSSDKPRVVRLAERLQDAGVRVWFDDWIVKPGDDIYLTIEKGLEVSRALVLCISEAALQSDWVGLERSTVLFRDPSNTGRRFIPLLLSDCKLPDTLKRFKYVDFTQESDTEKIRQAPRNSTTCSGIGSEFCPYGFSVSRRSNLHFEKQDFGSWTIMSTIAAKEILEILRNTASEIGLSTACRNSKNDLEGTWP